MDGTCVDQSGRGPSSRWGSHVDGSKAGLVAAWGRRPRLGRPPPAAQLSWAGVRPVAGGGPASRPVVLPQGALPAPALPVPGPGVLCVGWRASGSAACAGGLSVQRGLVLLFTRCQQPRLSVGRPRALPRLSRSDSPALRGSPAPESACFVSCGFTERQRPRVLPVYRVRVSGLRCTSSAAGQIGLRCLRSVPLAPPSPGHRAARAQSCCCAPLLPLPRGRSCLAPPCWGLRPGPPRVPRGAAATAVPVAARPSPAREALACRRCPAAAGEVMVSARGVSWGCVLRFSRLLAWGGAAGPCAGGVCCFDGCRLLSQGPFHRHPHSCM